MPFTILIILFMGAAVAFAMHINFGIYVSYFVSAVMFFLAYVVSASINIANLWHRAIVLRLGHFNALKRPGLFFYHPNYRYSVFLARHKVITISFKSGKTLTKNTLPVDLDAVLFGK